MSRRIWVAEGIASDGAIYGRSLRLPSENTRHGLASNSGGMGVQRTRASVLKSHLGDVPSCPCLAALSSQDDGAEP